MDVISLISKRFPFEDVDISDFNKVIDTTYANGPRVHEFLQEMYREVMGKYDVMTVGEGPGIDQEVANLYVGEKREELNMIFHFGHMFMDQGPGGRFDYVPSSFKAFKKVFRDWDQTVGNEAWINIFLDNHDFPRLVSRWGNDGVYRIPSAKLLATLVLTLRGTPCIYQGSEIGMTNVAFDSIEDYRDVEILNFYQECKEQGGDLDAFLKAVHIQGRDNVRTPIHWDATTNSGFTSGTPWIKVNPNYPEINIQKALDDPNSIFYYYQQMLSYRKANSTLTYGKYEEMEIDHPQLFQYRRSDEQETYIIVLNFSEDLVDFQLPDGFQWNLEMNNYSNGEERQLRAWEARVYRMQSL